MRKYLKYDLKSNKKFFASTFLVFLIFLISILSVNFVGNLNRMIEINTAINSFEVIVPLVLSMVLVWFIVNTFYKDLYTKRGILTFSLPISARGILLAKILVINLFYLFLVLFMWLLSYLAGVEFLRRLLIFLGFLLFVINFISQVILLFMQVDRFSKKRMRSVIISIIVLSLSAIGFYYILNSQLVEMGNSCIDFNTNIPYINLTSTAYFFLVSLILFEINRLVLKNKLDLS